MAAKKKKPAPKPAAQRPAAAPRPAAPPAPTYTPPPPVTPFNNAADLASQANFNFQQSQSSADIDYGLAQLNSQITNNRTATDRGAVRNKSDSVDDAASRGIQHSSIQDGRMYDIEAQRAMAQQSFTDQWNNAVLDANRRKSDLQRAQADFQRAMAQQAIENAQGVNDQIASNMPTPQQPGAAPRPAAAPRPSAGGGRQVNNQAGNPRAGQSYRVVTQGGRTWHVYANGTRVAVR